MTSGARYESVLGSRYASGAMQRLWSAKHRAVIWRRLWLALAEEQKRLGIDIPDRALDEMRSHLDDVDMDAVRRHEQRTRHDVMAHIYHFAEQAPAAKAFLHLGATSAFVSDNADLIIMRDAIRLLLERLAAVLRALGDFAVRYRELPTVAYTHFQPAQLTTVGKRATLWLQDLAFDAARLGELAAAVPFRGCKGTTGTQASYLELFDGDHQKVLELDRRIAQAFDFAQPIAVTGQTYTRKIDSWVLDTLSGTGQSAAKLGTDLRLLQHEGEVLEPVEEEQVGSSAMPYKRNPMRAERMCSLARYLISLAANAHHTAANQWLERSLDDSANRRLTLPEAFLAADAILVLCANICGGLVVNEPVISRNVERVMPFMATERWLMLGVQAGGDRQSLHEVIRRHARDASEAVQRGDPNDLLHRLAADPAFSAMDVERLGAELDPARYVGRAPQQVSEFVEGPLAELLRSLEPYQLKDQPEVTV